MRRFLAQLFSFEPLIKYKGKELLFLKTFAKAYSLEWMKEVEQRLDWALEKESTSDEIFKNLTKVEEFKKSFSRYKSRGLDSYFGNIDLVREAKEVYKKVNIPLNVLDVGSYLGEMLSEFKQKLKKEGIKIETVGINPTDSPSYYTDKKYVLLAEYLPKIFKEHFHFITAFWTLPYSIFPNFALRNIVKALAPKGRAYVHFVPIENLTSTRFSCFIQHLYKFYNKSEACKISRRTLNVINFPEIEDKKEVDSLKEQLIKNFDFTRFGSAKLLLWCNEISNISKDKDLRIEVKEWGEGNIGYYFVMGNLSMPKEFKKIKFTYPSVVIIKRVK